MSAVGDLLLQERSKKGLREVALRTRGEASLRAPGGGGAAPVPLSGVKCVVRHVTTNKVRRIANDALPKS